MADKTEFAAKFVETQPTAAARVLETQASDAVSDFVDRIPDPLSSQALASMLPFHAAKCLETLSNESGSRYLSTLPAQTVAAILLHMSSARRRSLLAALSGPLAIHTGLLLRYPRHTVGAWMDPAPPVLPDHCSVAEALERLEAYGPDNRCDIFLVNEGKKIAGTVALSDLVWGDPDRLVSSLARPVAHILAAASSLQTAAENEGWKNADRLPAVDRGGQLIGALRYADLRAGLDSDGETTNDAEPALPATDGKLAIAELWFFALAALLSTMLARGSASPPRTTTE